MNYFVSFLSMAMMISSTPVSMLNTNRHTNIKIPINQIENNMFNTSFLSISKNPVKLLELMADAKPDKIKEIIHLLQQLIESTAGELQSLKDEESEKHQDLETASKKLADAILHHNEAKEFVEKVVQDWEVAKIKHRDNLEAAHKRIKDTQVACDKASKEHEEVNKVYERAAIALENEGTALTMDIKTLEGVKIDLNGMLVKSKNHTQTLRLLPPFTNPSDKYEQHKHQQNHPQQKHQQNHLWNHPNKIAYGITNRSAYDGITYETDYYYYNNKTGYYSPNINGMEVTTETEETE